MDTGQIPGWTGDTLEGCSTPKLVSHLAASSCYILQMLGKVDISPGTGAEHLGLQSSVHRPQWSAAFPSQCRTTI